MTTKLKRGFATMDPTKRREVASLGGKAAQNSGMGHRWTAQGAAEAAKKSWASRRKPPQAQQALV